MTVNAAAGNTTMLEMIGMMTVSGDTENKGSGQLVMQLAPALRKKQTLRRHTEAVLIAQ